MRQLIVATAGHIDHGKTALVQSITGVNTDTLKEEIKRGLTIDIGIAHLKENITIIDVPGHEKFIKNMAAGVSNIHVGMLVVAADDGIMPQTIEHIQILSSFKIKKFIVVISKIDLIEDSDWISLIEEDISKTMKSYNLNHIKFFKSSIHNNKSIKPITNYLNLLSNSKLNKEVNRPFRMHVDKSFKKAGFGSVITGTVVSGSISIGEEVEILPISVIAKVRGIQFHNNSVDKVSQGDRAAINLSNIKLSLLTRGDSISRPGYFLQKTKYIANINKLSSNSRNILKNRQRVRINIGTDEVLARIIGLKGPLKEGVSQNVIIHLEKKSTLAIDDLFVIRGYSPMNILGSGRIMFNSSIERNFKFIETLDFNVRLRFYQIIHYYWQKPKSKKEWSEIFFYNLESINNWCDMNNRIDYSGDYNFIFSKINLNKSVELMLFEIEKYSKKNILNQKFSINVLVNKLFWSKKWVAFILDNLVNQNKVIIYESGYRLKQNLNIKHKDKNIELLHKIIINRTEFIISFNELCNESGLNNNDVKKILFFLKNNGEIIFISKDIYIDRSNFNTILKKTRTFLFTNKKMTISEFKIITGFSRKFAIPLLEFLDKEKYTIRHDKYRSIGR